MEQLGERGSSCDRMYIVFFCMVGVISAQLKVRLRSPTSALLMRPITAEAKPLPQVTSWPSVVLSVPSVAVFTALKILSWMPLVFFSKRQPSEWFSPKTWLLHTKVASGVS